VTFQGMSAAAACGYQLSMSPMVCMIVWLMGEHACCKRSRINRPPLNIVCLCGWQPRLTVFGVLLAVRAVAGPWLPGVSP
jgi:hypothetical protein